MHTHEIVKFLRYMSNCFLPCVFWIMIIFSFDTVFISILTVSAAGIHELGHILAMIILEKKARLPEGRLIGLKIKTDGLSSYMNEISVLLAGPLSNILAFLILLPHFTHAHGYLKLFAYINLATGLTNLIPADGYDGYGALKKYFEYNEWNKTPLEHISLAVSATLCFISLYMILEYAVGYWIFVVFFLSFLSKISKSVKADIF